MTYVILVALLLRKKMLSTNLVSSESRFLINIDRWYLRMKSRCLTTVIILFLYNCLVFVYAEGIHSSGINREPFFDAEPPSYLLDAVIIRASDEGEDIDVDELQYPDIVESSLPIAGIEQTKIAVEDYDASQKVTLKEAAQLIVNYHPRMAQVHSSAKGEEEMIAVAKSAYYPQVKGGLGSRYDNNGSNRYDKDYIQSIDLEIKQTIYDFGRTANAVKSAEYSYLGAKAYVAATNEELIYAATSSVVSIVRSKKLMALSKAQVQQVASIGKLVEKRYEKGASNLSDVLQAHSRLDAVMSEDLITSSQQQSQLRNLGILIGKSNLKSATIGELPEGLSQACTLLPDWEGIPELAIAEFESQKALADAERASAEELPTISLQGTTSRPLNAASRYGSKFESSISLNVSVPFYQGGGLSANKRATANRAQAASARKEEARLEIKQRLTDTQVRLEYMLQREGLLMQQVENLRGTKELYKKQYLELGTRSLLDLLNSEQEFHQAQVEVESNKSEIIQAQLECAFYQGKLRRYFNISD